MRIREAQIADAAELTTIAHAAKRSWGYPDDWMQLWAAVLTIDADVLEAMHVCVAEEDPDGIVGFYALAGSGRSVQLEHLWVRPDQMGRGVGTALVDHALAAAAAEGAEQVVIESEPNAEGFYRKHGAVRVGSIPAPAPGAADRSLPLLTIEIPPSRRSDGSKRHG